MSLDTVAEDIRDEARARAEEIRDDAESRAEEILSEADADAKQIREEREAAVEREIEQEREQRLSSAKLEAKQARLEARRNVLDEVRDDVEAAIADIDGDRREELTRELLAAGSEEFEGVDSVSVYGRAADEALLSSILADYEGYEYGGEYDCLGGVVLESESSRIRVNNTFDAVFEDVWEDNLRDVSEKLFDDQ